MIFREMHSLSGLHSIMQCVRTCLLQPHGWPSDNLVDTMGSPWANTQV